MKKLALSFILLSSIVCATPTTTVKLVDAGLNSPHLGNIIISPYDLSIYGKTTSALCVDFFDESHVGDTWNAYITPVNGNVVNTYQKSTTEYKEEAYIFSQITKAGISAQTRTELQLAAWFITGPSFNSDLNSFMGDANAIHESKWQKNPLFQTFVDVAGDITAAQNSIGKMDYSSFDIVSQVPNSDCARAQEYMVCLTPEPATYAMMGLALAVAGVFARRKVATKA